MDRSHMTWNLTDSQKAQLMFLRRALDRTWNSALVEVRQQLDIPDEYVVEFDGEKFTRKDDPDAG